MSEEHPQPEAQPPHPATGSVDPHSVEGLFLAALARPNADERRAFLDQACHGDQQRRRVEALLDAYDQAGSFLEKPAAGGEGVPGGWEAGTLGEVPLDFLSPSDQPGCLGTLGPYQVTGVIGRGGMGIVLRALDTKLNRIVAVKVLSPELAANPNARRRFLREAQAAAAVSHPHVVTIHAVDEDKLPYLVMECVVGQSLHEKLNRGGALRLTEILRIGRQIAEGLAAAHQQGLIHRDIKPANILLENGVERVKITDFGLARAVDDVAITRTGDVSGTPQYMSPEQARGEPVDHRSDLFSLGCVLYAMCTGCPPFCGNSLAAVIQRVTEESPRPIREMNPEAPSWLTDVINRLLQKDRTQRFQTAAEVAEVLAGRLARIQQPAGPAPLPGRQPAPPRQRLSRLAARLGGYGTLAGIGCLGQLAGAWAPPVPVVAVLLLAPLGWVAVWRGKRDLRRPWCELSYLDPAVAALAFLVGIAAGILLQPTNRPAAWETPAAGAVALLISAVATWTLILLAGGRRGRSEKSPPAAAGPAAQAAPARTRAERILVGLGIVLLATVLLVPACLIGLALLFLMLSAEKPKMPGPAANIQGSEQAAGEPDTRLPPGMQWEVDPRQTVSAATDTVRLNLRLLSEGLLVAIRRRSLIDGRLSPEERVATSVGTTELDLQPGQYEVLVRDERFGWSAVSRGMILVPESGLGTLSVDRDLAASLKPAVDFRAFAGPGPPLANAASDTRFPFLWNGQRYELTRGQAATVQKLADETVAGRAEVPEAEIVGSIPEPWRRGATVADNFQSAGGPAPAWGKLVVPGTKPGTYRLAPVPQTTLTVDIRTPGMTAQVFFPRPGDAWSNPLVLEEARQHRLTMAPGKYRVQLVDREVHWVDISTLQPIPSRTQELTLDDAKPVTLVVGRHWQDYAVARQALRDVPAGSWYVLFWFGREAPGPQVTAGPGFGLNPPQAAAVARLFQGLADGKPDVAEEQLLKAASAPSMPELFPGIGDKPPKQPWSPLFVPGDQPKTWRLNVPKAD